MAAGPDASPARLPERLALAGLIGLGLLSFLLPYVSVSASGREGSATGIQLVAGRPELRGEYLHEAFQGEVEELIGNGPLPARIAFAAAVLAVGALAARERRRYVWSGLALAFSLLGLVWLRRGTSAAFTPPESELRYGFWVTVSLLLVAGAYAWVAYRREKRRAEEGDEDDISPWSYVRNGG